ncbi:MAG: response regulator [Synergistales bacterium]|nr:response regulator [Synergistales bacterium]
MVEQAHPFTVLVGDDSMLARKQLRDQLEALEVERIMEAADGGEVVEIYKRDRPDLVMLDIVMSGMDGLAALERIMEYDPRARVVMASSTGTQANLKRAIDLGAMDFLQKPMEAKRLARVIDDARQDRGGSRDV